jgi:hypothetical protein
MTTPDFHVDRDHVERIRAKIERGQQVSAEDIAYVQDCIRALTDALRPVVDALRGLTQSVNHKPPVINLNIAGDGDTIEAGRKIAASLNQYLSDRDVVEGKNRRRFR